MNEAESRRRECRALLAWSNTFLTKRKLQVEDLVKDFSDGVLLINLVEIAFNTKLGRYQMTPKLSAHKNDNIQQAFKYLTTECKIVLLGIDSNDLVKRQEKQTINVLWNILRHLAMKGLAASLGGSEDSSGEDGGNMKSNLLKWVNGVLGSLNLSIKDFWDSFKDGIVFCAIVENLVPGSIDCTALRTENALNNLNLAFTTAEAQLGIPPLLNSADLAGGTKPDEHSVMNYVCMLLSVGKGMAQKKEASEETARKLEAAKAAKAAEIEAVKAQLEEQLAKEKQAMGQAKREMDESLAASMAKLQAMGQEHSQTAQEKEMLEQAFTTMQQNHIMDLENFEKERLEMRALSASLREDILRLQDTLVAEKEAHTRDRELAEEQFSDVQSKLYAAYKEAEDLMDNMRARINQRVVHDKQQLENDASNVNNLLKDAAVQNKSFRDFIYSLPDMSGWLMKKRPDALLSTLTNNKRYFTLKGEMLHWGSLESPFEKCVNLDKYLPIDRTGLGEQPSVDSPPTQEKEKEAKSRRASVVTMVKGKMTMRLVPRDPKKDTMLELMPLDITAKEGAQDLTNWVNTVNTRISLLRYLEGNFNPHSLNRGGREFIAFICNPLELELRICNKHVGDGALSQALNHFKEPLSHRKGISFVFNNVGLVDTDMETLCEIIENNNTVRSLSMRQNVIGPLGATRIATALKKNTSLTALELDYNNIKDEGLCVLSETLYYHKNLSTLSLAGNRIGDVGISALCQAMIDSQKNSQDNAPHAMKHMQLSDNLIGDAGAKIIARMIRKNNTVEHISMSSNRLTDKGANYLLEVASKHELKIKTFEFAENQISSKTLLSIASILPKWDHEVEFDLSNNKLITSKGVMAILTTPVPMEVRDFAFVKKDHNTSKEEDLSEMAPKLPEAAIQKDASEMATKLREAAVPPLAKQEF